MRIALAQVAASTEPSQNLALVEEYATRAAEAGAAVVVFPEATMASFATRSVAVAEPLDGPWAQRVREIARAAGVAVVVGMFTPGSPNAEGRPRARNTLLVADADGQVVGHYDKIHPYDAFGFVESRHIEPGESPRIVELGGVRVGLATCFDVRFPELFKHLAQAGAQVIVVPASWANGPDKAAQWRALCVARALDSTCFVLAPGQADPASVGHDVSAGAPTGIGHSVAVGPDGTVLAEAEDGPELLVLDLDLDQLDAAREALPVLAVSRFEIRPPVPGGEAEASGVR